MDANVRLGKLFGVSVGLHWSWFLIFVLVAGSLSGGYFRIAVPGQPAGVYWFLGILTSLLFFGSVLAHEFGHAIVAQHNHIEVQNIVLFVFGGVAQIATEPRNPGEEFRISVAGPLVSLACGLGFGVLWLAVRSVDILASPMDWLARINLALVVFNMIPAFPLDGGRILRAMLWKFTRSYGRATRYSSLGGRAIAIGFIGFGLFTGFSGNIVNGIWFMFIGWFLQNAALSVSDATSLQQTLGHVKVAHVMSHDFQLVPGFLTLNQLIRGYVFATGSRIFFIISGGRLLGMLTLQDIAAFPRLDWDRIKAEEAMIPINQVVQVHPDTALLSAITTMDHAHLTQVPVVQGEEITGLLSRDRVVQLLRMRRD